MFIITFEGDIANARDKGHNMLWTESLSDALAFISMIFPKNEDGLRDGIDPENDRILIRQAKPDGTFDIVWHFSGSHYKCPNGLPQGTLPGDELSLYEEVQR